VAFSSITAKKQGTAAHGYRVFIKILPVANAFWENRTIGMIKPDHYGGMNDKILDSG
jgi:uncharacterized Zn finger protein